MTETPGVTNPSSPNGNQSSNSSAASNQSLNDGRSVENVIEENKRKAAEIAALKEEIQSIKNQAEERLSQLEAKARLSPAELDLQKNLKAQVDSIKANPEAKAWLEVQREIAYEEGKKAAAEATFVNDHAYSLELVEELAERETVDAKEFGNELNGILKGGKWQYDAQGNEVLPSRRVKLAYQEWKANRKLKQELDKAKTSQAPFAETGGKRGIPISTMPTGKQAIEEAVQKRSFADILAKKAAIQQEVFK